MAESLLQAVLVLLDQIESPVILHSEALAHGDAALAEMRSQGVLRKAANATEIPRPARFDPGPGLIVRQTAQGLFGVADEGDYFDPVPLTDDDVRQYEIALPALVERLRRENAIDGSGFHNHHGLIPIGQKTVSGHGAVDVYLSLPNDNEDAVIARCRRLAGPGGRRCAALLTPCGLTLSTEARQILSASCLFAPSLVAVAAEGRLEINWQDQVATGDQAARAATEQRDVTKVTAKVPRSIGSNAAVQAVRVYMDLKGWDTTQFAIQAQTSDRTIRKFLKTGRLRRSTFDGVATAVGVTREQLLRGDVPHPVAS